MAQTVCRKLLEEIVPQYGVVKYIDSDQGTHLTSKITKQMAEALGIQWEYHTPCHPQSSGQVERMTQTLKAQFSKLIIETRMSWLKCLPLALLNIRTMPHSETGLSLFEMLYGMPYKHGMPVGHPRLEDSQIQPYLVAINRNLQELRKQEIVSQSAPLGFAIHKIQLAQANDDRVCLQYDRAVCFARNKDGLDPEGKMKEITQELKRSESELRKKRVEQERLKTLSEQYEQPVRQYADGELPSPDQNLFIDLVQEITMELGLSNCWICGGLKSAEKWPWKDEGLAPEQLLKWDIPRLSKLAQRPKGWVLDQRVIGTICISQEGQEYTEMVGYNETNCDWNGQTGLCWVKSPGANPYQSLAGLRENWGDPGKTTIRWKAPDGIYWICGKKAYSELSPRWKGSCTLGIIRPVFFTLPQTKSNLLGAPLYETLRRERRCFKKMIRVISGRHTCGEEACLAGRIIDYYGPATWAQDGSYRYRTPIYLLNRLIRLQAVVEIVLNHTSEALDLLSRQHSQVQAFVYQNQIALDYLLAKEGGVCGKFNESECCIEIDDYGSAEIRKVAHVPKGSV
uniref:Uncharacterized protein n=1 Tax=Geospiza parvula TaxID=87175 RepID=A0A8U8AQR7_GEOPR